MIIAIVLAPQATTIQAVIVAHPAMTAAHLAVIAAAQVHLQAVINFSDKSPLTGAFLYLVETHKQKKPLLLGGNSGHQKVTLNLVGACVKN